MPVREAYRPEQVEVRYVDVYVMARHSWSARTIGLTVREPSRCLVLIEESRRGDLCVLSHELKHCSGYDHPKYPLTPAQEVVCGDLPQLAAQHYENH